jgi:hypothetical protein
VPVVIKSLAFAVEDIDAVVAGLRARGAELVGELERYEDSYRLCYVRGRESSSSWRSRSANGSSPLLTLRGSSRRSESPAGRTRRDESLSPP